MDNILLLGAGKIGGAIVELLGACGDYHLTVGDRDDRLLDGLQSPGDHTTSSASFSISPMVKPCAASWTARMR